MGEAWLCDTCFHYPRRVLEFAGEYSQTLSLSCPDAARLAFGTADALEIVPADIRVRPSAVQHARPFHGIPLDAMHRIHRFCLRLMRRRDLALWQRLGVLGTLCEGLQGLLDAGRAANADALLGRVAADVDGGGAVAALVSATPDLRGQALAFATLISEHPVPSTSDVQRRVFSDVVRELTGSEARQAGADTVVAAYARGIGHLEDALRAVPHLLDHYVLNEMLAVGFPFERTAPMDAYRCLAGQFGTLRFLLAARCANDPFPDAEALVDTACVFARRFAHDQRFAKAVSEPLPDHGWTSARSICSIMRT
jgi:lysine-N-methylase